MMMVLNRKHKLLLVVLVVALSLFSTILIGLRNNNHHAIIDKQQEHIQQPPFVSEWLARVPSDFKTCYLEEVEKQQPIDHLKKLAIVVSSSPDRTSSQEYVYTTNNHKCYAKLNGYDWVENIVHARGEHFFYERHLKLLSDVLPNYQWILHIDSDTFFPNLTNSLDPFFVNRLFDVSLNIRLNGEVHSNYLVKNSAFSRCFLRSLYNIHKTRPGYNADNGDIIQLGMCSSDHTHLYSLDYSNGFIQSREISRMWC
jgi:hypothetical protein